VTTKTSRDIHRAVISKFLQEYAPWLFSHCSIVATGRTAEFVSVVCQELVQQGKLPEETLTSLSASITKYPANSEGIVAVTHDLVEGKLVAVFHLSHYTDINTTFSSSVLRRQAALHNVVYADSVEGCSKILHSWRKHPDMIATLRPAATQNHIDFKRFASGQNNLALIAHDGKKLDMCLFFTENAERILVHDRILATGTTGSISRFCSLYCNNVPCCTHSESCRDLAQEVCESDLGSNAPRASWQC
jgi:methylglyoxal synthase